MAININPNRIHIAAGQAGDQRRRLASQGKLTTPRKAEVNTIPSPESLRTLISSAVSSLRQGVFWDRGTILNLLV